jgi:23S rRNA (adenine2503-C2)-methyltransferase
MISTVSKQLIYDLSLTELEDILQSWEEPKYRALQIWQGIYQQLWSDFAEFSTLPRILRERLSEHLVTRSLLPGLSLASRDGDTVKTLFTLPDQRAIEAVWMGYSRRNTLCISTQSGCAMGCEFCATGQMGFKRNLSSGEIIEQVLHYARQLKAGGESVTNIVVMGMGEPFHNYDATLTALDRLNLQSGFNMGARRFTISTVGLVPAIRRFTSENRQYNLAVSLHAADDQLRASMLPINNKYPLDELFHAIQEYADHTRRRITFEWAMINNINDDIDQARKLAQRLKGLLCHVNIIPLNPTQKYPGIASPRPRVLAFQAELERHGIPCTIRLRRGIDIQAGCGQLAIES